MASDGVEIFLFYAGVAGGVWHERLGMWGPARSDGEIRVCGELFR